VTIDRRLVKFRDRQAALKRAVLALGASLLWASPGEAVPFFEGDPVEIAAYGDSLTDGGDWFPYLPSAWSALDFGQAGDECWNDVVPRLEVDLDDPAAPPEASDVVVIFCGTNDVRIPTWTLDRTMDEIEAGTLGALAAGLPVVVVAPPPIFKPSASFTVEEINDHLEQVRDAIAALVADQIDLGEQARYANAYDAFLQAMRDGATIDDLYSDGGVHPIGLGRQIEADVITGAVLALPEPSHEILWGAGLAGLVVAAWARRRS
jgi:lysophospholipase L1-like esterase